MNRNNKQSSSTVIVFIFIIVLYIVANNIEGILNDNLKDKKTFNIIASTSTEKMDNDLINYAKKNGIKVNIDHYGDLEIVDILNENNGNYDAVWISNSIWLYQLDNSNIVTDSKSIVINPVVMGISKSKANELGFIGKDVYNKDLLNAIKEGKLSYIMASVTKTNTGATTYLSFLNSLAGSPEILTEKMLDNETLKSDLKSFFKGVERVSGDEKYLSEIFMNGKYDSMINYESSLIDINKELIKKGREPLYLIYPVDGVAINDMPFAYINNDSSDTKRKEQFLTLQSYLRSDEAIKLMENYGYRSWYGGTNAKANKDLFNIDWGIDTTKYLKDMKYPSKAVITKAINLYINSLRKPTHVVFCLDTSGSMYSKGLPELKDAMKYILNKETASKDKLQFSDEDIISIISFNSKVDKKLSGVKGSDTSSAITFVDELEAGGDTNIYDPSIEALKELEKTDKQEYTRTIILMTDGYSNVGRFRDVENYYRTVSSEIPIYSITFGTANESQLYSLAKLSNGKVFNGTNGLKQAFAEVRSYN